MAARPPRDRRAGPAIEEGRQRADRDRSAGARSTRSTCASAASTGRRRRRELAPLREQLERAREEALRDGALGRRASTSPTSSATTSSWRCAQPGRVPDRPRPARLDARARHRRRRVRRALRGGAGRRTRPRCTPGCAGAAPTWSGRWPATASTSTGSRRSRARRREAGSARCRNPFQSIVVRAVEILYAFDEALRLIDATSRRTRRRSSSSRGPAIGYGVTEAPRGMLYHRYELDDDGHDRDGAGSCRRPRRTRRAIEEDLRAFVAAQRRARRRGAARCAASRRSATTTPASPARRTSCASRSTAREPRDRDRQPAARR